ncbi:EamA family transporter [Burkholderia pseudomallei]|uniref:EamA family transporter n=1 Tax=Burkholderia pseudomallei TaxID=28450 RepID=A0A8A4DQN8_BURPE|nr:DMT family transporter [Burkholderia pseudomallei]AIV67574.1 eamA-like transporter family protein [Burkholderia pseudomallei K42]APZ02604.1 multidrug DMT transporter permease [Burkholderia pseudomallei]APZ16186.1 multidrug DMT transporter permease [Burkholderia pseudomallei]KGC63885.1 eamA-like transporter family protein [Burkholderia pseudomallei]KGC94391.1 eamA-like transporter family protein [Burkholderia pseudomallei]
MEQRFVLLVLLCALLHAVWNALLHASEDRVAQLGTMSVPYLLAGAAGALALPPPPAPAWPYVAASALLELGYCAALLRAYRSGDFSRIYPIARGLSPLTVCALALIALGERPTPFALAGIALVSLGIASLALRRGLRWSGESVPYALVTGLFIAAYSVVDGRGVRLAGDPLAYVAWVYLLWNAPQFALICRLRGWRALARSRAAVSRGLAAGVLSLAAYAIAIAAYRHLPVATVSALRETSSIFAIAIGWFVLRERPSARRLAACALVVAGAMLIRM